MNLISIVLRAVHRGHEILGAFFVKLCSKSFDNLINPTFEPEPAPLRGLSYCALDVLSDHALSLLKLNDSKALSIRMYQVENPQFLELNTSPPLFEHDWPEYLIEMMELLPQFLCNAISPLLHYLRAPILEYPPGFELLEESECADLLELVALLQPASQWKDLRGLVVREDEQALSRHGVVLRISCFVQGMVLWL